MADQRILRGASAVLSWQNVDSDGEPAAPSGTVTVGVVSSDGTVVKAALTATSGTGSDPRTVTLTAAQTATLDVLTATWTDGGDSSTHTTTIEIVGGYYFTLAEARYSDDLLADGSKVTNATLKALRWEVENEIEAITGVAFVPRYRYEHVIGTSCNGTLLAPYLRSIRSITSDYGSTTSAWSANDLTALTIDTVVGRVSGYRSFAGDLLVGYEHGMDRPPPDVKRAALDLLRDKATRPFDAINPRASSYTGDEQGTIDLAPVGPWKTGLPRVDAVLDRYSMRVGIA